MDFKGIRSDEMELLTSNDIGLQFSSVIEDRHLQVHHHCILTEVVKKIRTVILRKHCEMMNTESETSLQGAKVWDVSEHWHGKVRYVSGWVVAKLIHGHRSYLNKNVCSSNMQVQTEMNRRFTLINHLESLLFNSSVIHASTKYASSLGVIDQKQYRENALVYVNDETFEFFMELEKCRVNSLTHDHLKESKGDLFRVAVTSTKQNSELLSHWKQLFENAEEQEFELLFHSVVERYFNMGCGQYLRNFRREYNIQKTEAHRKRVIERKTNKDRKEEKVAMESIKEDNSQCKENSHRFLVALVIKRPTVFNTNLYNKVEI